MKRESSRCKSAKWLIATLLVSGATLCAVGEEANAVSGLPEVEMWGTDPTERAFFRDFRDVNHQNDLGIG